MTVAIINIDPRGKRRWSFIEYLWADGCGVGSFLLMSINRGFRFSFTCSSFAAFVPWAASSI
ncbi:MAG: hypothetical protein DRJ42_05365 [Deltaproteobacteria bacterium]|nr:MAG: hypothetical protein DRJ42_05365 [Deltaproteobacteria bacterium]